jgi:hypothetical protein
VANKAAKIHMFRLISGSFLHIVSEPQGAVATIR